MAHGAATWSGKPPELLVLEFSFRGCCLPSWRPAEGSLILLCWPICAIRPSAMLSTWPLC